MHYDYLLREDKNGGRGGGERRVSPLRDQWYFIWFWVNTYLCKVMKLWKGEGRSSDEEKEALLGWLNVMMEQCLDYQYDCVSHFL